MSDLYDDDILLWSKTPYRYYKRQSQDDPNSWVWLSDSRSESARAQMK